jgi:hypothetical protein
MYFLFLVSLVSRARRFHKRADIIYVQSSYMIPSYLQIAFTSHQRFLRACVAIASRTDAAALEQQRRQCSNKTTSLDLCDQLLPCVPKLFSTVSNIERKLPADLQREVGQRGGLQAVLQHDPRFVLSMIGKTVVVRALGDVPATSSTSVEGSAAAHNVRSRASIGGRGAALQAKGQPRLTDAMPAWCHNNMYPRFCVPLDVLCAARRVVMPGVYDSPSAVENEIRHVQLPLLHSEVELVNILDRWFVLAAIERQCTMMS